MIPYGRQDIIQSDIDAVVEVLKSDWLTQGPLAGQFENAIAAYCGAQYGVAVNSGTSALHIACLALGLGPGDYLWTSPITFVASANCALYCGASVDFVDIDANTWNMSVTALREKLAHAERVGKLPKVVVPVHFAGQPCEMEAIAGLAQQYGFRIIEDASHAIGARYKGEPVGNCRYSDITVFSFHPVKIITTGEGGMAMTNDAELAHGMRRIASHGITRETTQMTRESEGEWYYQQLGLGYNYRLTDIQAALGISQLKRLENYVEMRHLLASYYSDGISSYPVTGQAISPECKSSWHLYVICLQQSADTLLRKKVFEHMRASGIGVNVHYIPVHMQPYYERMGFQAGDFPNAENYYNNCISLPMFPGLELNQVDYIISSLVEVLQ